MLPALVAFDLDDTLTTSKRPMSEPMTSLFVRLCEATEVAIISGGLFEQFRLQVLDACELSERARTNLHLMPTCGTRYVRWRNNNWELVYEHVLDPADRLRIAEALRHRARQLGYWVDEPWGEVIEDRGSQLTYSALGQKAPTENKSSWDPDGTKRARLAELVASDLPDMSVRSGGSTSVDVTMKGVDKAYGLRQLMTATGYGPHDIVFFGDRLDPNGNDYPVLSTGVDARAVTDWRDTANQIKALLA